MVFDMTRAAPRAHVEIEPPHCERPGKGVDQRQIEPRLRLGPGHALLQTESLLKGKKGSVLLLSGDVPLLSSRTLQRLIEVHDTRHAALTVLTTELSEPYGYGRIVRDDKDQIARIVEERDASAEQHQEHQRGKRNTHG